MLTDTLELNTVYERDLGDLSHGTLTHEEMIDHYMSNSSPLSFFIEKQLEKWFDNLEYNPKTVSIPFKDKHISIKPDLRGTRKNTIYDQKAFNRKGGSFSRSSMKGVGRTYIKEENDAWASSQVFIWTDFCSLPKIKIIALTGDECMKRWPTSKISFKDREKLFTMGAK